MQHLDTIALTELCQSNPIATRIFMRLSRMQRNREYTNLSDLIGKMYLDAAGSVEFNLVFERLTQLGIGHLNGQLYYWNYSLKIISQIALSKH